MASKKSKGIWRYAGVVTACFVLGLIAGLSRPAKRIDNFAYDELSIGAQPDWEPRSVVVAIDEQALGERGGMPNIRAIESEALDKIALAEPVAVATDLILADASSDPARDERLAASMRSVPGLILSCDIPANTAKWEDPLPLFQRLAVSEPGHVELMPHPLDGVTRQIPLEQIVPGSRRWALSLQALAVTSGQSILETPEDVEIGDLTVPAPRSASGRPLYIRYLRQGRIPVIPMLQVGQHLNQIRRKTVFLGITALSAARDRVLTPNGGNISGVEAHAQAFETLMNGQFLVPARDQTLLLLCLGLATATGLVFGLLSGWPAYLVGAALLGFAHYLPVVFFRHNVVLPYFAPVVVAWLSSAGAATYQHFFVRRQLRRSETERSRYQQAIHWAAHEMRTPLTAIQGSSEIMTRYQLPDAKRNQLTEMINSESKRLARIIQTFLDVERLAEGQMELKREPFAVADIVDTCLKRIAPLAERKKIGITLDNEIRAELLGDRELMEYAFYNLLTNAVKYSPAETHIRVFSLSADGELRLSVQDQGIGMDAREVKNIFKKFYRTKRAEASGEAGTGIGLSIVEQIVTYHGGRIHVTSEPGKGSCFTIVVKAHVPASVKHEIADRRG